MSIIQNGLFANINACVDIAGDVDITIELIEDILCNCSLYCKKAVVARNKKNQTNK